VKPLLQVDSEVSEKGWVGWTRIFSPHTVETSENLSPSFFNDKNI